MAAQRGISRRQFLRRTAAGTAAAAGFPYIVPARALGLDGHVAPSNRVVMGSIGLGGQGSHNTRGLMGLPEVQYVAVCDVDRNHLERGRQMVADHYAQQAAAGTHGGVEAYHDFREMLARPDIDAVMIAPPDHWHAVMSIETAKAGKDIYCEKPLGNGIPEGRAVVEAVQRYGRVFQTGSHERSRDNARYAAELVLNGRIGKVHTILCNMPVDNHGPIPNQPEMPIPEGFDYDLWLGPAPLAPYTEKRCHFWFRYILDYSGGEMTDRGAHIIDLAQLGNGTSHTGPKYIEGAGDFPKDGLFNSAMSYRVEFTYESGVKLISESVGPRGVKFIGEDGWVFIHVHGGNLEAEPASLLREVIGADEIQLGRSRGHHHDFVQNVLARGECKAPPEVGHRSGSMCHLANIAMKCGRRLEWNPDTEQFVNDAEANRMLVRSARSPWQL